MNDVIAEIRNNGSGDKVCIRHEDETMAPPPLDVSCLPLSCPLSVCPLITTRPVWFGVGGLFQ